MDLNGSCRSEMKSWRDQRHVQVTMMGCYIYDIYLASEFTPQESFETNPDVPDNTTWQVWTIRVEFL